MPKKNKFYKKAKSGGEQPPKLPRNYRIIPEKILNDHVVFLVGILCILFAILLVSLDLYSNYRLQKQLASEKIKVLNSLIFWENEVKKRPNYRDGYFELALLNYQLKNFNKASLNLQKVFDLDPNFEKGIELRNLLENTN